MASLESTVQIAVDLDDIDRLLERYSAAEDRIAANLVELDDHPTYGIMTSGALTGATAHRVADVTSPAAQLWVGLDALRQVLERARGARAAGRLGRGERVELGTLLTGPSVVVSVVETPLADRDLLGEASTEQRVTIDELLDRLRRIYEPVRDTVAAIDVVWRDVLPRLDAADTTLTHLDGELIELAATEPTVSIARQQLRRLRTVVMDDPLSLDTDAGERLDAAVAEAARQVGRLRHGHEAIEADLARTEVLIASARVLRAKASAARRAALAKVADPRQLIQVPAEAAVEELASRADALRRRTGQPWQATRSELDQWLALTERLVEQLRAAEAANRAPLDERDQLRGLLSAYRAKAAAVGVVEFPDLADLADDAHAELFTAPTDLDRARQLLTELGAAIQSQAIPSGASDSSAHPIEGPQ